MTKRLCGASALLLNGLKKSAAKTLAYRSASKGELTKKLLQKGFSEEDSKEAVLWLEERGFVDDESYANALVEYYTARGYGERRINEELRRRGISREICEEISSRLPDFTEEIKALIEKKLRGDALTYDKKNKIGERDEQTAGCNRKSTFYVSKYAFWNGGRA